MRDAVSQPSLDIEECYFSKKILDFNDKSLSLAKTLSLFRLKFAQTSKTWFYKLPAARLIKFEFLKKKITILKIF